MIFFVQNNIFVIKKCRNTSINIKELKDLCILMMDDNTRLEKNHEESKIVANQKDYPNERYRTNINDCFPRIKGIKSIYKFKNNM